jgi:epoxide hydrolase-like predicted phosphatase
MRIQAVIFDIGGVLSLYHDFETYFKWERQFELPKMQLLKIIYDNPASRQAMLGKATVTDVWEEVGRQLKLPPDTLQKLQEDIWNGYRWNTELLDFARSLKPNYKTGILSDAWADARESMRSVINTDLFDVVVFSAEEGVLKPDPTLFQRAVERLGVKPEEAIFLDDRESNVQGAEAFGMHGVHFTETNKAIEDIRNLLQDPVE